MELAVSAVLEPTRKFSEDERDDIIDQLLDRFPDLDDQDVLNKMTEREMGVKILTYDAEKSGHGGKRVQILAQDWRHKRSKRHKPVPAKTENLDDLRQKLVVNKARLPSCARVLLRDMRKIVLDPLLPEDSFHINVHIREFETLILEKFPRVIELTNPVGTYRVYVRAAGHHDGDKDEIRVSQAVMAQLRYPMASVALRVCSDAPEIGSISVKMFDTNVTQQDIEGVVQNMPGLARGMVVLGNVLINEIRDVDDNLVFVGTFKDVGFTQIKFFIEPIACYYCMERVASSVCKQCNMAAYCGKRCQSRDWNVVHSLVCNGLKRLRVDDTGGGDNQSSLKRGATSGLFIPSERLRAMLANRGFLRNFVSHTDPQELVMTVDRATTGFYAALRADNFFWYLVSVRFLGNKNPFDKLFVYRGAVIKQLKKNHV